MSYNRGPRNGQDYRHGVNSYYDRQDMRNSNQRFSRQNEKYPNLSKDVSRGQDQLGLKVITNTAPNNNSSNQGNSGGKSEPVQEGLSAEEKRKLRQAKLAKWKQKQGSPADIQTPLALVEKKLFKLKILKPEIKKKGLTIASVKVGRALFEDETDSNDILKREVKKPKLTTEETTATDVDPLEMFMEGISQDKSETVESSMPDLMDDDFNYEDEEADTKLDSITDLLNQSNNIHKAKDIPHIPFATKEIRKKFYDASLNSLKTEDIHEFTTINQITIKPDDGSIRPVKEFGQLGITSKMLEVLNELAFTEPTPIQKIALPLLMSGHDVIAVAKTGSGKTLGFVLPMIRHILANVSIGKRANPIGLILTPTRELALQIYKDCKPFLKALDLRGVCCYGGSNISSQIAQMKKGTELIVCTPGRLIDLLTANNGRVTNLSEVSSLVLDEADRMFDLGFEPQIMKIINNIRPDRQTCLFSATFAKKIENLATKVLVNPVQIIVGGGRSIVSDTITQRVMVVKPEEKFFKMLKILGEFLTDESKEQKILIFCSTQDRCDNLVQQIVQRGYKGRSIHGGKDQGDRDNAIHDFQKGSISILVATSIAARGLDVKDLGIVINYDAPNHIEDYVHRVGRTGRAGKKGIAYTFVEPSEERAASDIAKALKVSKNIVPDDINELAEKFQEKVKDGKEKFSSGFGGKGLEKLEETRLKTKNNERKTLVNNGELEESVPVPVATPTTTAAKSNSEDYVINSIDFKVIDGPVPGKLDSRLFHSKIYINDLPQKVRVLLSQQYPIITEQTNVSITTKGTFNGDSKEEKLHILIESDERMDVVTAVSMIENTVIEGIKDSNEGELRKLKQGGSGKYTV